MADTSKYQLALSLVAVLFIDTLQFAHCCADEEIGPVVHLSAAGEEFLHQLDTLIAHPQANEVHTIQISHSYITNQITSKLAKLSGLRSLYIGNGSGFLETPVQKGAYNHLSKLKQLRELRLIEYVDETNCAVSPETSISFIDAMTSLEHLELDLKVTASDMAKLTRLPHLKSVRFRENSEEISDLLWSKLVRKASLRCLEIDNIGPEFSIAAVFSEPAKIKLKELHLSDTFNKRVLSRRDVEALTGIDALTSLMISSIATINAADTELLQRLTHLEELQVCVRGNLFRFPVVRSSQQLSRLNLFCDSFRAYRELADHPSLAEIEISGDHHSEDILHLAKIPNLRRLRIRGEVECKDALVNLLKDVDVAFSTPKSP